MLKFLLNANISHETASFLNQIGYEAKTVAQFNLEESTDQEIVNFATKHKMIIVTLDLDFGEIFYFSSKSRLGIIILKLADQRVESVNKILIRLLDSKILNKKKFQTSLIIVDENKFRIRTKP